MPTSCHSPGAEPVMARGPVGGLIVGVEQRREAAAQESGREMLLHDRCLAAMPALTDLHQHRRDDVLGHALHGVEGECLGQDRFCLPLVEGQERTQELLDHGWRRYAAPQQALDRQKMPRGFRVRAAHRPGAASPATSPRC